MASKANLDSENFGIEIETAGQSRAKIAQAVAEATDGRITSSNEGVYDATIVTDNQNREWKIHNDGSIATVNRHRGSEIVSPVLTYPNDIEILQNVIRKVRSVGALPHNTCAVHIHIDGRRHTPASLNNLAKMVHKNEDLLFNALNVNSARRARWCRPMEPDFIEKIVRNRPRTKEQINEAWFGCYNSNPTHYESHRYHGLNYNNLWRTIETIEFRYFNASLHAGKIKSWIQLCLAMGLKARNSRSASHHKITTDNPKFNFRVWLVSGLGMVGEEFKTARHHLLSNLTGNSAWR